MSTYGFCENKCKHEIYTKAEIDNFKNQKVLWQDDEGSFMVGNQTAPLSEKISEQNSGIVLVFSAYSDDRAQNAGWYSHYIPKKLIELKSGQGHGFLIPDYNGAGIRANKYLYISDELIEGNDINHGTYENINNSLVVLRYVIGV